jgi:hypothetical protein
VKREKTHTVIQRNPIQVTAAPPGLLAMYRDVDGGEFGNEVVAFAVCEIVEVTYDADSHRELHRRRAQNEIVGVEASEPDGLIFSEDGGNHIGYRRAT